MSPRPMISRWIRTGTRAWSCVALSVAMGAAPLVVPASARAASTAEQTAEPAPEGTASATAPTPAPATAAPAPQPTPDPRVTRLQAMYAEAQQKVTDYNIDRRVEDLRQARGLLTTWLEEHRVLYGDTPAALQVRAPVQQQLDAIENQLAALMPPPGPPPPAPDPAGDTGKGLINAGTSLLILGSVGLVGVALPLWAARNQALDRANSVEFRAQQDAELDRARRRHNGMVVMFGISGSLAAAGIAMLAVGGAQRSRARRRVSMTPHLGPGFAGASATLRF